MATRGGVVIAKSIEPAEVGNQTCGYRVNEVLTAMGAIDGVFARLPDGCELRVWPGGFGMASSPAWFAFTG